MALVFVASHVLVVVVRSRDFWSAVVSLKKREDQ